MRGPSDEIYKCPLLILDMLYQKGDSRSHQEQPLADNRGIIKQPVSDQISIFTANRVGSDFTRRATARRLATQARPPTTKRSLAWRWR